MSEIKGEYDSVINGVDKLYTEKVLMHGPAFDGTGNIVERYIVRADVTAFKNAGYELGANPVKSLEQAVEKVVEAAEERKAKKKGK